VEFSRNLETTVWERHMVVPRGRITLLTPAFWGDPF
jgi:hypothetical protein